jgi:hypothetical protein
MTSFSDMEILCPHCGTVHLEAVMMSTNNSGWSIWSDGFEAGVFNRRRSRLRLCIEGHPFLISDAEHRTPTESRGLARTILPSRRQLYAIADGVDEPPLILDARLFAWWDANAEERDWGPTTAFDADAMQNARALASLLIKHTEPFTLAKGQLARQLGWFTEAQQTYEAADDLPDDVRVHLIALARHRDGRIVKLRGAGQHD